jgi:hypothetical protein
LCSSGIWYSIVIQKDAKLMFIVVNIPITVILTKLWLLQTLKICFHWFGVSPTPFSFPLPYLQSIKLPQTLPHNRHTFSTATFHHLPKPSHIKKETIWSTGEITKPTIWWKPKRWQSSVLKEQLFHNALLHAPHLISTLDILQQSIPSTAFP